MKHLFLFILSFSVLFLKAQNPIVSLDQLSEINQEWNSIKQTPELNIDFNSLTEIEKIQLHLSLVEENLRAVSTEHLTPVQLQKRSETLDILNRYWNKGVFPQNIYHAERTPYFIDHLGTHCAVGHLMMMTGRGDIATLIHKENNYGYVKDLVNSYPEILEWAQEFGFTVQELAWIQPGYPICSSQCNLEIYLFVESDEYVGEITYFLPELGTESNGILENLCPGTSLEIIATDEEGTIVPDSDIQYFAFPNVLVLNPIDGVIATPSSDVAELEITTTSSSRLCDGEINLEITNNVEVTDIIWTHELGSSYTLTNQCYGWYDVEVITDYECHTYASIFVKPDYFLCTSDLNHDFSSDVHDLTFFLTKFGCEENCECDLNNSGTATTADLTIFLGVFGIACELE